MEKLERKNMKTCYFCKGTVRPQKIEYVYRWKGKIYLFEGVKAEVCKQCGEFFLPPKSLQYMEGAIQRPSKARREIKVPVFSVPRSISA